jgi:hypothetical protein
MTNKKTKKSLPKETSKETETLPADVGELAVESAEESTEDTKDPNKITIDGKDYLLDNLSEDAKNCVGHLIDIQNNMGELQKTTATMQARMYQLELAKQVITENLKGFLPN